MLTSIPSTPGIYEITCMANGRTYIGSSVSMYKRLKEHIRVLRLGQHYNIHLQRSWDKHGEGLFEFSVLDTCDEGLLLQYEQFYIDSMSPEFNICKVAGSPLGVKHSDERIKASSERVTAWWKSEENRAKMSISRALSNQSSTVKENRRNAALRLAQEFPEKARNHSVLMKEKFSDPVFYESFCARVSEAKNSERYVENASRASKEKWKDPTYRLKNCALTDEQAVQVILLKREGLKHKDIAEIVGCSKGVVDNISSGKTYKHINRETLEVEWNY